MKFGARSKYSFNILTSAFLLLVLSAAPTLAWVEDPEGVHLVDSLRDSTNAVTDEELWSRITEQAEGLARYAPLISELLAYMLSRYIRFYNSLSI